MDCDYSQFDEDKGVDALRASTPLPVLS